MSDYIIQKSEKLNGGYEVTIGDFVLRKIGKYAPTWSKVYDDENSFTDYLGNQQKILMGNRFALSIDTGRLTKEETESLIAELNKRSIAVVCPDFEGECYCDNAPANLEQANFYGTRYKVNFTLTAKNITSIGGGL